MKKKPIQELMSYSAKDLRFAANWMDRENGVYPLINVLSLSKKLTALNATLKFLTGEQGEITFFLEEKGAIVTRYFSSAKELSVALTLGPVDLFWVGNLFLKTAEGNLEIIPRRLDSDKNQLHFTVKKTKEKRFAWLNRAENILCNNKEGLTAGQIKLNATN